MQLWLDNTQRKLKETKMLLTINTPVGTFTRNTNSAYKAVVVWNSPRAKQSFEKNVGKKNSGVDARWVKDNGFAVTWHGSKESALKATKQYLYDANATVVGVFEL
jgi:hypothetical protein